MDAYIFTSTATDCGEGKRPCLSREGWAKSPDFTSLLYVSLLRKES